ncbi:MAG: peptidoglycan editing factor PgeF [Candidatus Aminicenantes bacterium]|nr:peptidoglycan editing factor PgeF [Candidatus Aminicenantes bacterium]
MHYLIDESLSRVPDLVHGFGRKDFNEYDLQAFARERNLRPVLLDQIHSDVVHIIDDVPPVRPRGDALVTNVPGLLLVVKTADCLPLLLMDERLRVVAAIHAGWRGTRSRIVQKTVRAMKTRFGTNPADIVAAAGPCIGPACYEVGEDVRREFLSAEFPDDLFVPAGRPGKYFFDLEAANALQLRSAGVPPGPPAGLSACNHCDPDFHSYRRDHSPSDRMFSFIGLFSP